MYIAMQMPLCRLHVYHMYVYSAWVQYFILAIYYTYYNG